MNQEHFSDFYLSNEYQPVRQLLDEIRLALLGDHQLRIPEALAFPFDPAISQVYITLFQRGTKPLRWGAKKASLLITVERVVEKLKAAPRLTEFVLADNQQCRLMVEMVVQEKPCAIRNLTGMAFTPHRFEPGITGFKYVYQGVLRYFMPTDAIVHSIMTVPQLLQFLAKQTGIAKQTKLFSERETLMRREPIEYHFIQSIAFISYAAETLSLQRGYPTPVHCNKDILLDSTLKSMDWLIANMNADGSFLYFYDGYLDTKVDLDHPKMADPLYNNILRHSGGTITLLRGYELTGETRYLEAAEKSLGFLLSTCRAHEYQGQFACYPFDNKKSKLGGAGIGLVALMHHYQHTRSEQFRQYIDGLVRHILSRVDSEGEMIGYYIHPQFNGGEPLIDPPDEIKKQLFSFYYPGEALLGLALYYQWINNIDTDLKTEIYNKSLLALDFLVQVRPVKYQELFLSLPADAWLMQAIEEWVKVEGFKQQAYIDFVFNDARAMIEHAYQEHDAPYADYIGGFYYNYGDHVYHDASRCEGLVAAYYMACYLEDSIQAEYLMAQLLKSAKGLLYTRHTPESTYAHKYPEKSINSFRFKLTRQWVRVDSVQHAACFLSRLWLALGKYATDPFATSSINDLSILKSAEIPERIGDYKVIDLIDRSGFSHVFLVEKEAQQFALKKIKQTTDINRIYNEIEILNKVQALGKQVIKFHFAKRYQENVYIIFDYAEQGNLKKHILTNGTFKEIEALNFISQLLDILEFTFAQGIMHLDIKPANILLKNNNYCLADWGLAVQSLHVKTVYIKGNPMYLAPETFLGYRGFPSEIYALGCCLYFLVLGKHLFNHQNSTPLYKKIYTHLYQAPNIPNYLPKKIRLLLLKMLAKQPENRPTIEEIRAILGRDESSITQAELTRTSAIRAVESTEHIALCQKMAEDGVAWIQYELGKLYDQGNDVEMNKPQAFYWFQQAASQNLACGQYSLGLAYLHGNGTAIDFNLARFWLNKAALQEHGDAQFILAEIVAQGLAGESDEDLAVEWYKKAAHHGNKAAYKALKRLNQSVGLMI